MPTPWQRGLDQLAAGEYWEAHESWEDVWRDLPDSQAREATQALIQFAAACYKPEQAASGRDDPAMQQGMGKLIGRARDHLEAASESSTPATTWELSRLEGALADLEDALADWRDGEDRLVLRRRVASISSKLAEDLDAAPVPPHGD